jgi:hypothetical protein
MAGIFDEVIDGIAAKEKGTQTPPPPAQTPAPPAGSQTPPAPGQQTPPPADGKKEAFGYCDDFKKRYESRNNA